MRGMKTAALIAVLVLGWATSCKKDDKTEVLQVVFNDDEVSDDLRINQLQYLGSHNSYRKLTNSSILAFLKAFEDIIPLDINDLDYDHVDLNEQFSYYGVRQIELDFYADADGGRFYSRRGNSFAGINPESGIPELLQPGNKLIHIADIDYETHYYTLRQSFEAVKDWSRRYPSHLPIFILLETKTQTIADQVKDLGFTEAEPWDAARINSIEEDILAVFDRSDIITPDMVRGESPTLNEAILSKGWPTVGECRGKVMFLFDQANINSIYRQGSPSLEGKLIFTASTPGAPDGAFIKRNNPFENDIKSLVEQGYLVRTMVGGTNEGRSGDYSKLNAGMSKGAHFLSTDYYRPDPRWRTSSEWTDFKVTFERNSYKFNPVTYP